MLGELLWTLLINMPYFCFALDKLEPLIIIQSNVLIPSSGPGHFDKIH